MNVIVTISEEVSQDSGPYPIVPGAALVIPCADNHFKAVGPSRPTPGGPHAAELPCIAKLWRAAPGLYAVEADEAVITKLDKAGAAKTFEAYVLSAEASDWPCRDEATGDICISSALGFDDTRSVKRASPENIR